MVLGKAVYGFYCSVSEISFYFTVIMKLRIMLSLLCSIPNYFSGGPDFETVLILEKSGNLYCGTTNRYVSITGPSFMESYYLCKGFFIQYRCYKFFQDCFKQNQQN